MSQDAHFRLAGTDTGEPLRIDLPVGRHVLGSGPLADLRLRADSVSRRHAALIVDEGVEVEDLSSRNGTFVGGRRVRRAAVELGDEVAFGAVRLVLEQVSGSDARAARSLQGGASASWAGPGTVDARAAVEPSPSLLGELVGRAVAGESAAELASRLGAALSEVPGVGGLVLRRIEEDARPVLYDGGADPSDPHLRSIESRDSSGAGLELLLVDDDLGDAVRGIERLLDVLLLADRRRAEPAPDPEGGSAGTGPDELLPEPRTRSPAVRRAWEQAIQVAASRIGVLVLGESGTGKELLAGTVHSASPRHDGPFVAINCAALPRDLLEAELFGIEKGVATGVAERAGCFERAHGGTLFLDEIGDMPLETQALLLRVIQEQQVVRVGGDRSRPAGARIVAATHRDVDDLLGEGRFRRDLFYRIAACQIPLPPLRARRDDVANLAVHFAEREARTLGKRVSGLSESAMSALEAYDWPGNVRQLELEMARAVALVPKGALIDSSVLSVDVLAGPCAVAGETLPERVARFERREIARALERNGQDVAAAVEELGISRATLYRKLGRGDHGSD